jgi:hypothetical protein
LRGAVVVIRAEPFPYVFGLSGDYRVGEGLEVLRAERGVASARHYVVTPVPVEPEKLLLPLELHPHAADAYDVGYGVKRYGLYVFVYYLDVPIGGAEGGQCGEPEGRVYRPYVPGHDVIDCPFEAPEALRKSRVNE